MLGRRLGERAREFVKAHHSEDAVESRIVKLYEELKKQGEEKKAHIERRTGKRI